MVCNRALGEREGEVFITGRAAAGDAINKCLSRKLVQQKQAPCHAVSRSARLSPANNSLPGGRWLRMMVPHTMQNPELRTIVEELTRRGSHLWRFL